MVDVFTSEQRSQIMSYVKSSGNKSTELKLVKLFKIHHIIGWRRNYPLSGKPDFVFPLQKVVVFTDGCFWHGHNCRNVTPEQNYEYWQQKIARNKTRDQNINYCLEKKGWEVIRLWECKLRKGNLPSKLLSLC